VRHAQAHSKAAANRRNCGVIARCGFDYASSLVNLAVHNMQYVMSRSPLIWYPKDLVLDVVMGRISIFAQFDIGAFFNLP
jgi:hypothetical protein